MTIDRRLTLIEARLGAGRDDPLRLRSLTDAQLADRAHQLLLKMCDGDEARATAIEERLKSDPEFEKVLLADLRTGAAA